jgi:hypothetical protein
VWSEVKFGSDELGEDMIARQRATFILVNILPRTSRLHLPFLFPTMVCLFTSRAVLTRTRQTHTDIKDVLPELGSFLNHLSRCKRIRRADAYASW